MTGGNGGSINNASNGQFQNVVLCVRDLVSWIRCLFSRGSLVTKRGNKPQIAKLKSE